MDVPEYLASDFKALEEVGYQLRREYGGTLRKYIKYEDDALGLMLEIKLPGEYRWTRMPAKTAKEIRASEDHDIIGAVRTRMRRRSAGAAAVAVAEACLLYTSPSPRDGLLSRMPSSA